MGGSLVLPWSESIRYAVKKNGYHGGVCRQEMLVPIGIWTAGHSPETDGVAYQAAYPEAPTWWNSTDNSVATPNRAPTRRSKERKSVVSGKSESVRLDPDGRGINKTKTKKQQTTNNKKEKQ